MRVQVEHALRDEAGPARTRRSARDPDLDDLDLARVLLAGVHVQPDLRPVEGRGHERRHGLALHLSGRGVHARWHVARNDASVLLVDRPDGGRDGFAGRALEPGAQQGVYDHTGIRQSLALERLGAVEDVDLVAVLA